MKIVANWKMNLDFRKSLELANNYLELQLPSNYELIVLASDLVLEDLKIKFKGTKIKVFAQDCSRFAEDGGFTGEISAKQLAKLGVDGVFLGHIERRKLMSETDEIVSLKVENALDAKLKVILGIGEVTRDLNFTDSIAQIKTQLDKCLSTISEEEADGRLSIAYESVKNISSLKSATDKEDDLDLTIDKISFIDEYLKKKYPRLKIDIYTGGSLDNSDITRFKDRNIVNGFLIGKKSLTISEFKTIVKRIILQ